MRNSNLTMWQQLCRMNRRGSCSHPEGRSRAHGASVQMEPLPEPRLSVRSHTVSVNGTSLDGPLRDRGRVCAGRGGVGAGVVGAGRVCVCAVTPAQVFSRMPPCC